MKDIEKRIERLEQRHGVGQEEFILHVRVVRFIHPEDKLSQLEGDTTICTKDCPVYESKLAEARKRAVNGHVIVCCHSECRETKNKIEGGAIPDTKT